MFEIQIRHNYSVLNISLSDEFSGISWLLWISKTSRFYIFAVDALKSTVTIETRKMSSLEYSLVFTTFILLRTKMKRARYLVTKRDRLIYDWLVFLIFKILHENWVEDSFRLWKNCVYIEKKASNKQTESPPPYKSPFLTCTEIFPSLCIPINGGVACREVWSCYAPDFDEVDG